VYISLAVALMPYTILLDVIKRASGTSPECLEFLTLFVSRKDEGDRIKLTEWDCVQNC
jgi:hypothetical protein